MAAVSGGGGGVRGLEIERKLTHVVHLEAISEIAASAAAVHAGFGPDSAAGNASTGVTARPTAGAIAASATALGNASVASAALAAAAFATAASIAALGNASTGVTARPTAGDTVCATAGYATYAALAAFSARAARAAPD